MCGRYGQWSRKQRLEEYLRLAPSGGGDLIARYNIAPGTHAPILRALGDRLDLDSYLWGLVPFWAKDPKAGMRPINAKAETAHEKPMFRKLLRGRRCLVPADCFYEWKATPAGKAPYCICMASREPFFFAGLWDVWHEGDADAIPSFALLTTKPNELMATIHDRMPVIVRAADQARWLDPDVTDPGALAAVLTPFPADEMMAWPVTRAVNNARNEGPQLIEPIPESIGPNG
jgi:putative SOS response-associated peptidase YedK